MAASVKIRFRRLDLPRRRLGQIAFDRSRRHVPIDRNRQKQLANDR